MTCVCDAIEIPKHMSRYVDDVLRVCIGESMMRKLPALLENLYDEARKYLVEFLQLRPPFCIHSYVMLAISFSTHVSIVFLITV